MLVVTLSQLVAAKPQLAVVQNQLVAAKHQLAVAIQVVRSQFVVFSTNCSTTTSLVAIRAVQLSPLAVANHHADVASKLMRRFAEIS